MISFYLKIEICEAELIRSVMSLGVDTCSLVEKWKILLLALTKRMNKVQVFAIVEEGEENLPFI